MIGGFLDEIKRNSDRSVNSYEVELDDITYITAQTKGSGPKGMCMDCELGLYLTSVLDDTGNTSQNRRSKTRFNFDDDASSSSMATVTPENSTAVGTSDNKKRRAADSVEDGIEGEKEADNKGKKKKVD